MHKEAQHQSVQFWVNVTDFYTVFQKLTNHPTKAQVKFENHRISFDDSSPPIKGFSLTRAGFTLFMLESAYLLVVQCCVIVQNFRKGHVCMSL